jgi:GNAT superfamily N-acetyltransferase
MLWRAPYGGRRFDADKGEPNKHAFRELVTSGRAHGVLAFSGNQSVGWCSIGPRSEFPGLARSRVLQTEWNHGTWSVTCFFVPSRWRGCGVAAALLDGAIELARSRGAKVLEGYPVRPRSDAAPLPAAFAWTGLPSLFERAGFEPVASTNGQRTIYRLEVEPNAGE